MVSGRVSQADFDYVMSAPMEGRVTASEKLRYLFSAYRRFQEGMTDEASCVVELQRLLEPSRREVLRAERDQGKHSELVEKLFVALPELMATLIAFAPEGSGKKEIRDLTDLEARLGDQVVNLLESVLRLAVSGKRSPTYSPQLFQKRLEGSFELLALIQSRQ